MQPSNLPSQKRGASQNQGKRIDLNNFVPDRSKKHDLKRRLYDSGISNIPMPSVKRPIEENIAARLFSARMNSNKIQSMSPVKQNVQQLNTSLISKMNDNYKDPAIQEARAYEEQQTEYYNSQAVMPGGSFTDFRIPAKRSTVPPKLHGATRGFSGDMFQNRQLLKKHPKDLPALDAEARIKMNQSLNHSYLDNSKLLQGPPGIVYAGFEGGASISQKQLEQARSKFLLDKLTGKLSREMKGGMAMQLNPLMHDPNLEKKVSRSKASHISASSKSRVDESELKPGEKKKDKQQPGQQQKWSDLDKYIELLLDSKSEEETVFVYLNPNPNQDPYDLLVCSYQQRNEQKYYTLSGKGLTLYENDTPIEFLSLGQWLIERDSYNHIKELPFFKKFKRWKFMRMWKKTIKHQNRMKAQNSLEEKLFTLQDHFSSHLMKHRQYMLEMEKLRFVDICRNSDTKSIHDFAKVQEDRRKVISDEISKFSGKSRENVKECISKVLSELRERIVSEIALDEERKKNNPIQSSNTITMKRKASNNVFEKLGFPEGMTYGHRSSLRKECSRFLRFAYLVDFLSLEALANIYTGSVHEMIKRLRELDSYCDIESIMSMEFDEANRQPAPPVRGREPLFYVSIQLNDREQIPEREIVKIECDDFRPPPGGTSKDSDFDMLCHLELEPEVDEKEKGEDDEDDAPSQNEVQETKYKLTVPNIQEYWLKMNPDVEEYIDIIVRCFAQGLDQIQAFERWSQHHELSPYADALEEWDDIVGDDWDETDQLMLNPFFWINENPLYSDQKEMVRESIESAFEKARLFLTRFQSLLEIYWRNKQVDFNILVHERLRSPVESLAHSIKLLNYYHTLFNNQLPSTTELGLLQLDSKGCRSKLLPTPKQFIAQIEDLVPKVIRQRCDEAKKWLQGSIRDLQKPVTTVEEFVEQNNHLNYANERFQTIRDKVDLFGQFYNTMAEYQLKVKKEDKDNYTESVQLISQLANIVSSVESAQDTNMETFKKTLNELIPVLNNQINTLNDEVGNPIFLSGEANMFDILRTLDELEGRFKELENRSMKYNQWQEVLQTQPTVFDNLDVLREALSLRCIMWRSLKEWEELTEKWIKTQFNSIQAKDIAARADQFAKVCLRLEKNLEPNPIQTKLKSLVDTFKGAMPIVVALRNENLKEHHWKEIKDLIQADFDIQDPQFTLQSLIDLNVNQFQEDITATSTQASQEASLRLQLQTLEDTWRKIDFVTKQYKDKDAFILDEIDEIFQSLDEGMATINMILGSRYVKPLRTEAELWKKNLFTLNQIVEEWVICQKQWIYLENIFGAADIKKQLPTESTRFEQVDKFFKQLMHKTHKSANCIRIVKTNTNLLDQLKINNDILDDIQKKLEDYLENKRMAFPRFYFLSNDELLEILANSQNLEVIQQHLKTCFDNIVKLDISEGVDILAMFSIEGERVAFNKVPKVRGLVEQWLASIQTAMIETLQKLMRAGLNDYQNIERKQWVKNHSGQVVATIAQIMWCSQTEVYINDMNNNPLSLQDWFEINESQLAQLTELVRGNLSSLLRKIIVALVTTDVHARDIVEGLMKDNVSSTNDFQWQQQLRYYWDEEIDDCRIKQVNAILKYGYEYMGATSRLVITPLTDRCWITITGALHIKLGANPAGPAGTGKTESTKDLAKALGMLCIVFNCSDQVDYKMIGRLFSGLCQQGAWACLDEFNRIDIEVLSVIAQQLLTIREALIRGQTNFQFEGKFIELKETFGVHVTMNPGYAGRTELPDNLKVLFRPVAMMIPDYGLIAEIMLFAEGFGNAKILSKKMVQLYKLSSEQLSQQDHYDFGMRAVKSVLVMAGSLKRANPGLNEDAVLIRAMRDSNVPKFLKDDLPLFSAIVQDLFPTVEITESDYGELQTQIEESIEHYKLQQQSTFILKVIQLFETFNVRFGVMLVGPTGGGKTTCYQVLQHTMSSLKAKGSKDDRFQSVKMNLLNPKSISMGELYGEVNPISQEWHDGLASKLMRQAALEQGDDKTWVIFDGPVDALWIENMNTVLDDNMTLCLANGQRIKLRAQMRILFEVQDLAVASPATVSRCGMVYLTPEELGWRPFVKTWITTFFEDETILSEDLKQYLYALFDTSIDQGLDKIREHLNEPVATVNIQQVVSLCNFLEVLVNPNQGFKGSDDEKRKLLTNIFAWSYIWGMGASLDERSKERFDDTVRECFKNVQIPPANSAFDYFFDLKKDKSFKPWSMKVPQFVYDKDIPYFELLVPTADTYRHAYCLELLLTREKCAFFTGFTGVGKSVVIQNTLQRLQDEKDIVPVFVNFSAQTSSMRTQQTIEDKLEKKKRTLFGAPPGKKIAIFVDDINMPATEQYGAQPPIELLRLFIDKKGIYDRDEWSWKDVEDTTLIAAAAPPGGGRSAITLRFTRHFNMFCMPNADKSVLTKIFGSILQGFLKSGFQDPIQKCEEAIVSSTIEIYQRISEELRPTPAKFHYLFNLRDVSKVFQGILMVKPISITQPETIARLWINESLRVFYDRLINNEDRQWFKDLIMELLQRSFRMAFNKEEIFENEKIMFGDLLKLDAPVKLYEEIKEKPKLLKMLNGMLEEYNLGNSNKMNLVFFDDAIEHILRIARVLRQPRGNIMLIGVGGSGKQSLIRLSSYMLEIGFKQIEITKNYGPDQFKDFMKDLMFQSGIEGKPLCFVMTDTQIIAESFLEDINNMLNTGEIPNLMLPEDKDKIINGVRPIVIEMKKIDSIDSINQTFIQRVRDNLHICLCMSPVGDTLRVRCRMFPSLVNCCTLDWFSRWPEQALLYVSSEFLKELELPSEEVRSSLAEMCMVIHTSVEEESERFFGELRRRVYTTPKSYLDLINLYLNTLDQKRYEYNVNRNRLATGLKKLNDTNKSIAELRVKLTQLQPLLQKKNEDLKVALEKVNADKKIANEKEIVVTEEAQIVNKKAQEAKVISDDAEMDLNAAKPELEAAEKALQALEKAAIVEIKTFPKPPDAVKMVMEAIMILLNEKTDWNAIKVVLGDTTGFINRLLTYDVSKTPESTLKKVRTQYLAQEGFNPDAVGKQSLAARSLCVWALSVSKFQIVLKKVEPKRKKYEEVQAILNKAQAELNQKMSEVNKVKEAVAKLEAECQRMQDEKERLESDMDKCEKRMGRAEKLVVLLADEGVRWKETVSTIQVEIEQLVGNVFLSCACISYFGAFTGIYRKRLVDKWVRRCIDKGIPTSDDFSVIKIMGDPVVIRGWNIANLPTDQVSIENGILATKAQRWALCIDPQQQANRWIKNMEKDNNMLIMKFGTNNFLREISGAVRNGRPCLIEDIEEYIDPAIDPILLKQAFKTEGGIKQMRLGDSNIDYDENFKFFMTTKMPNPHYLPEVCIKVTLINFTVTFQGLEEQLLGDVVVQEKPEIEKKRDEIVVTMDADQRTLKNIEITILKLLSESTEEQILDEDNLIIVLENSKKTSKEINERMSQSLVVEEEINNTRNQYRTVAVRGSILYFVIADLAGIDPMYQYSLGYVKRLFNQAIEKSKKSKVLDERLEILIDMISKTIFTNVSRGLFEAHKIIFSFLITTSINRNYGKIKDLHWNNLLRGAGPLTLDQTRNKPKNPDPKQITTLGWDLLFYVEILDQEIYGGLTEHIVSHLAEWLDWATKGEPHTEPLPSPWEDKLLGFEKLIILKAFRPEKLLFAFQNYVIDEVGKFYVESPSVTMEVVYADTDVKTPLIFVLSQGADPTSQLIKFAKERNYQDKLNVISLGQGQGPKADALIKASKKNGEWVMLQNCHLAKSWMPSLENIVINFGAEESEMHPEFRLYLTSMPADYFPVSVLQNGVKLTTEPPRGLKANLKRSYQEMSEHSLNDCKKPDTWKKLLFGLCFFHAIIQERRKFGPLGWNIRYEFNDSDLETSMTMLKIFLDEPVDDIPWDALLYVTGHINYGGRVTDDWDRRCLLSLLARYYTVDVLEDGYKFSQSGIYFAPTNGNLDVYKNYIDTLPLIDEPEVFGLHENANITYQNQESEKIVTTILAIQPRIGGGAGVKSPDEIVMEKAKELKKGLPALLEKATGKKDLFKTDKQGLISSLSTVLLQEMQRFNRLLTVMRYSLGQLKKAIKGFIVMSEELDSMYISIQNNQVPKNWEKVAYPSLKPLTSWYKDLIERVAFMQDWLSNGQPNSFWLSGFFFPQGFMTGCLQTHARNYKIAIDKLQFSFQILPEEEPNEVEEAPEDGVYIYGLFMDGARWDRETQMIADQYPGEMYNRMPLIWFKPQEDYKPDPEEYSCPIYKTSVRAGVLSTTGQSTNFIVAVELPTKEQPRSWTLKAAAMLCQLND